MQAMARRHIHPQAVALGLIFYADGAEASRNKHSFHPLLMYMANFTLDAMRSQRGYARLAHLCVLDKADFPCFDKKPELSVSTSVFLHC